MLSPVLSCLVFCIALVCLVSGHMPSVILERALRDEVSTTVRGKDAPRNAMRAGSEPAAAQTTEFDVIVQRLLSLESREQDLLPPRWRSSWHRRPAWHRCFNVGGPGVAVVFPSGDAGTCESLRSNSSRTAASAASAPPPAAVAEERLTTDDGSQTPSFFQTSSWNGLLASRMLRRRVFAKESLTMMRPGSSRPVSHGLEPVFFTGESGPQLSYDLELPQRGLYRFELYFFGHGTPNFLFGNQNAHCRIDIDGAVAVPTFRIPSDEKLVALSFVARLPSADGPQHRASGRSPLSVPVKISSLTPGVHCLLNGLVVELLAERSSDGPHGLDFDAVWTEFLLSNSLKNAFTASMISSFDASPAAHVGNAIDVSLTELDIVAVDGIPLCLSPHFFSIPLIIKHGFVVFFAFHFRLFSMFASTLIGAAILGFCEDLLFILWDVAGSVFSVQRHFSEAVIYLLLVLVVSRVLAVARRLLKKRRLASLRRQMLKYKRRSCQLDGDECPICLEPMHPHLPSCGSGPRPTPDRQDACSVGGTVHTSSQTAGAHDEMHSLPDCGHTFHASCLARWLTWKKSCPLCRHQVDLVD